MNKKIILGSGSPRRRELLASLDVDFEVDARNYFEERFDPSTPFEDVPCLLSQGKSHAFHRPLQEGELLITADTMVILPSDVRHPGEILGKPRDRADAIRMLALLSGREHKVVTAVTFRDWEREETIADTTYVHFASLSDEEIAYYVDRYRPYDKAGAYAIQEWIGQVGIVAISGSYFNVVGFPVHRVYQVLRDW